MTNKDSDKTWIWRNKDDDELEDVEDERMEDDNNLDEEYEDNEVWGEED